MKNDMYIAKNIVLAQISSDGGKGIKDLALTLPIGIKYSKKGYCTKDHCIIQAIKTIQRSKSSIFRFYVKETEANIFIVYFNFKYEGVKYQVSFHSFKESLRKYCNKKYSTRWLKRCNSRIACIVICTMFKFCTANADNSKPVYRLLKEQCSLDQQVIKAVEDTVKLFCKDNIEQNIYNLHFTKFLLELEKLNWSICLSYKWACTKGGKYYEDFN